MVTRKIALNARAVELTTATWTSFAELLTSTIYDLAIDDLSFEDKSSIEKPQIVDVQARPRTRLAIDRCARSKPVQTIASSIRPRVKTVVRIAPRRDATRQRPLTPWERTD
jgi:hypothetical protein